VEARIAPLTEREVSTTGQEKYNVVRDHPCARRRLPSATVFLLLLCNDHAVLGPWVNGRALSVFTGAVIAALVMLSIILTASVFFPDMSDTTILAILGSGMLFTVVISAALLLIRARTGGSGPTVSDGWSGGCRRSISCPRHN
jgi:hypothetical protein